MKNLQKYFIVLFYLILLNDLRAQTYQFTQFYNTYQIVNPALSGITGQKYRLGSIFRWQWLGVSPQTSIPYQTTGSFGHFIVKHPLKEKLLTASPDFKKDESRKSLFSWGGGFLQNNQSDRTIRIQSTFITLTYLKWIGKDDGALLSFGYELNSQSARLNDYIFVNDYLIGSNLVNPGDKVQYANMSFGLALTLKYLWFGATLKDVLPSPKTPSFYTQNLGRFNNLSFQFGGAKEQWPFETSAFRFSGLWKRFLELEQFEAAAGVSFSRRDGKSLTLNIGARAWIDGPEGFSNSDAVTSSIAINNLGPLSFSISSDLYNFNFGNAPSWEFSASYSSPLPKLRTMKSGFICTDYSHVPMAEQIAINLYGGREPYASEKDKKDKFDRSDAKKKTKTIWSKSVLNGLKKNHGRSAKKSLKRRKRF